MKTIMLTAPEGYEFTGEFREPRCGEWYLSVMGGAAEAYKMESPRYILRKLPPPALHLSDLKPGEKFKLAGAPSDVSTMLRKHPDDVTSKKFVFFADVGSGITLFQRNDDAEVVRA